MSDRTQDSVYKAFKDGSGAQAWRKVQPRVCVVFLWISGWSRLGARTVLPFPGSQASQLGLQSQRAPGAPVLERGCRAGRGSSVFFRPNKAAGAGFQGDRATPATTRNRKHRGCAAGLSGQVKRGVRLAAGALLSDLLALCGAERQCRWGFTGILVTGL